MKNINKKLAIGFLLSVFLNVFLLLYPVNFLSIYRKIAVSNITPIDNLDTTYLATGVVAFKDIKQQPKDIFQIQTFYIDNQSKKIFLDESFVSEGAISPLDRKQMQIVSYDENGGVLTLSGNGFDKVVLDVNQKQLKYSIDSTGDITTLKNSWEIK